MLQLYKARAASLARARLLGLGVRMQRPHHLSRRASVPHAHPRAPVRSVHDGAEVRHGVRLCAALLQATGATCASQRQAMDVSAVSTEQEVCGALSRYLRIARLQCVAEEASGMREELPRRACTFGLQLQPALSMYSSQSTRPTLTSIEMYA